MADIDSGMFRQVMGAVPTCVTVVASIADEAPQAMVIGSFGSVSLDPPLVQFMPGKSSATWAHIEKARKFCVNVLTDAQVDVCNSFFKKDVDPFTTVEWTTTDNGSPKIADCLAYMDCDIHEVVDGGDHWIVLGRIVEMGAADEGKPLVFFRGGYGTFEAI